MSTIRPHRPVLPATWVWGQRAALLVALLVLLFVAWLVYQSSALGPTSRRAVAKLPAQVEDQVEDAPAAQQLAAVPAQGYIGNGDRVEATTQRAQKQSGAHDSENAASGGVLVIFRLQPLAAPCCPAPTPDQAVQAAQAVPGVLAAEINADGQLLVHYDPAVADPDAIAAAINRASFIAEMVHD